MAPIPSQVLGQGASSTGLATGGWDHKGVSTNNRKRVLPSSDSLRLTRGGDEGPGEGVRTARAFVLRQAWREGMQLRGRW